MYGIVKLEREKIPFFINSNNVKIKLWARPMYYNRYDLTSTITYDNQGNLKKIKILSFNSIIYLKLIQQ